MFCDLVGSTALSRRLDPEELRSLVGRYHAAVRNVVERYEGHVAQLLGDGAMCYFGWPTAHEDDAERALRAALDVVDEVRILDAPERLQVRVGAATGIVVVGTSGSEEPDLAVGETPNLAARLQGVAEPGDIVIGEATRHLVGGAFELTDLGERTLKGVAEPLATYRVEGLAAKPLAGSRRAPAPLRRL